MKIDLITGFLGAGKTTLIRLYAEYLVEKGEKICILENDYGAVNVDMMFLQDLLSDRCELEMVIGGDGLEAHRRRFKTKLISMAMVGYNRVIVEPSGVYDTDEFFDTLREEPLDRWYEPGNVISVVSADTGPDLSEESAYLLASQIANAGCVILSKVQEVPPEKAERTALYLNEVMEKFHCERRFSDEIISVPWDQSGGLDFDRISRCGFRLSDHIKYQVDQSNHFSSLFYFYVRMDESQIREAIRSIFDDPKCGHVHRIKGFVRLHDEKWIRINAVSGNAEYETTDKGEDSVIVIGEDLCREEVDLYLKSHSRYSGEL
jgi:G3E family GTPase